MVWKNYGSMACFVIGAILITMALVLGFNTYFHFRNGKLGRETCSGLDIIKNAKNSNFILEGLAG